MCTEGYLNSEVQGVLLHHLVHFKGELFGTWFVERWGREGDKLNKYPER